MPVCFNFLENSKMSISHVVIGVRVPYLINIKGRVLGVSSEKSMESITKVLSKQKQKEWWYSWYKYFEKTLFLKLMFQNKYLLLSHNQHLFSLTW